MCDDNGLICAYLLDGNGGGEEIDWDGIQRFEFNRNLIWIHLDRKNPQAQDWLKEKSGLDSVICEALLAEVTRPRVDLFEEGMLLILRGVNLNAGADPEDMISIRMWIETNLIITLRSPKLMALSAIRENISKCKGPKNTGDFLVQLAKGLVERMEPIIAGIDDEIEQLETKDYESEHGLILTQLTELRRRTSTLRRYISPQRDVLIRIQNATVSWLTDHHRDILREVIDHIRRYVEDLDMAKEHAVIANDSIENKITGRINKTMYLLSLVTAIFLPLGLLTGLLGINVGGIPGSDYNLAFLFVCFLLAALAAFQIWLFRKFRFF